MAFGAVIRSSRRGNLAEILLDAQRARSADRPAVRTPTGIHTYEDLARQTGAIAGELATSDRLAGLKVALVLPDSPLWIATFLALVRLGATVALASPSTPYDRLRAAVDRLDPQLVCTDIEELWSLPGRRLGSHELSWMAGSSTADPGPAPTRPNDPCYLLLTSGSTGPPKWAIHRHSDIPACIATYGRHILRLHTDDVTWSVASLSTSYGLGNAFYFPLGAGASSWITGQPPSPREAARACTDGGATVLFGVPTFWARLARHAVEERVDASAFREVRLAVSAGEPLPGPLWRRVRAALGLELVDGLGSSEATNLYLSNRPGHARPDSLGWVVPGFEVRVVDRVGDRVDDEVSGELEIRGATVMSGYLNAPDATAGALRDGWLRTGDLVARQPDATFRFVGRVGERLKISGFWVDPAQIERVLMSHPSVAEVAVSCAPDDTGVARLVAVIVARNGDRSGLRRELNELAHAKLSRHEIPRHIRFVSQLPTAPSGKVRRGEVQALAAAAMEVTT